MIEYGLQRDGGCLKKFLIECGLQYGKHEPYAQALVIRG